MEGVILSILSRIGILGVSGSSYWPANIKFGVM